MTAKKPPPEKTLEAVSAPGEAVAVVRVISRIAGNLRFIREFGAAGEFLRSTICPVATQGCYEPSLRAVQVSASGMRYSK